MEKELQERLFKLYQIKRIKKNAKALYLLSDLGETYSYLWARVDDGIITDEQADKIVDELSEECKDFTIDKINQIRKLF